MIGKSSAQLNEREKIILDRLSSDGSVSVGVPARDLGLLEVTIRGDLKALEGKGWVNRKRGGAAAAMHRDILERQRIFSERKSVIARYLTGKRDIHIVTNSTLVFSYARMNPNLQITMTSGEFRRPPNPWWGPLPWKP
jgi:DeoR family galactitol utilization operon repressor